MFALEIVQSETGNKKMNETRETEKVKAASSTPEKSKLRRIRKKKREVSHDGIAGVDTRKQVVE